MSDDKIQEIYESMLRNEAKGSDAAMEGVLEFLDKHRNTYKLAVDHARKVLKQKSDQKPFLDYAVAEMKLWDKLVGSIGK